MSAELVYEIARHSVQTDAELFIEHAQVINRDGVLWRRVDDGPETCCPDTDVGAAIGADPLLSEIRANQVTRISAELAALRDLPVRLADSRSRDRFR